VVGALRPQDVGLLEFLIHGLPGRVSGKARARVPWRGVIYSGRYVVLWKEGEAKLWRVLASKQSFLGCWQLEVVAGSDKLANYGLWLAVACRWARAARKEGVDVECGAPCPEPPRVRAPPGQPWSLDQVVYVFTFFCKEYTHVFWVCVYVRVRIRTCVWSYWSERENVQEMTLFFLGRRWFLIQASLVWPTINIIFTRQGRVCSFTAFN
jgi:hypothetical protein